ncbi:hypothetical protein [Labrenzia sp. DG1229]|uniref:hypothetical protein n=1 Tax=Labrenzia sp. DG1229 TaxID=681847 RepID=UPI000491C81B|nr:hypothetical protein [Labrenzia sp. DG1229]
MSGLANPHLRVLSETQALRDRRDLLLRKAQLHWFRPHQMRQLQEELQQVTTDLLKRELEARARPDTNRSRWVMPARLAGICKAANPTRIDA